MWQNVKSIIGFLCIFVYISAAALAVINIYKAVNEQRFEAQQELADLADFASRAGALGFFTDDYAADIKTQLDISKSIDALIIYGPGGKEIAFEKKSGLISYKNDYPDFTKNPGLYRAPQTLPIRAEGNLNVSMSALSPLIDVNTLHSLLRSSLLAILITVVAAFTTLIVDVSLAGDYAASAGERMPSDGERESLPSVIVLPDKTAAYDGEPESNVLMEDESDEPFDIDTGEPEITDIAQTQIELPSDENEADPAAPEIELPSDKNEADPAAPEIELPSDKNKTDLTAPEIELPSDKNETDLTAPEIDSQLSGENPDELFSELPPQDESAVEDEIPLTTAIMEEEAGDDGETAPLEQESAVLPDGKGLLAAASELYETDNFDSMDDEVEFPDILQGELNRAEKSGKDLTLLDIEWSVGGLPSDPLVKQASAFFKQGSRFFEKEKGDGIYIIVPDGGLDEIFTRTKEFHKRARAENHAEFNSELLIGLSSRSDRNVDAVNLLNEAERALAKAHADIALPIVAFKVDPQKYKDFMSKKRKTA